MSPRPPARRCLRAAVAALCLLAGTSPVLLAARAQAPPLPSAGELAALDAWITAYQAEHNVPGVLVALASAGRVHLVRSYGLANVELDVPVTDSTVFEIGSISKQFVAAAVMLLVQEGRLGLDDPIHRFLPELPSEWYGVTVRQLLTHTSGIPDYEEIGSYDVYRFRLTPEEVIQIAHARPMDFAPGTGYYYSNTGYFLLSRLVERLEGAPLGQVLDRRLFAPLGMTQTRMADPEALIRHRAAGYWVDKSGGLINRMPTETSSTLGAGGLLSSARDLARWDAALAGDALLSPASKAAMWTPAVLPNGRRIDYGFGWDLTPYRGLATQRHTGQVAGFQAYFARFPARNVAVIVFQNRYRAPLRQLYERVTDTLVPGLAPRED